MPSPPSPYRIDRWGDGFFSVGPDGRLRVHPRLDDRTVDLPGVVAQLADRGAAAPVLVRFPEILGERLAAIGGAFREAIEASGYRGSYRGVYPIKVNQDRHVVEHVLDYGREMHVGLEAGSKPELLVAMALLDDPEAPLVCNGYKDVDYVESAADAARLGRRVVLVAESLPELGMILATLEHEAAESGSDAALTLGLRVRLASPGSGRWEASSGDRSKFGFSGRDLVDALALLRERGRLEALRLVHFHLGSQISSIRSFQDALSEAAWIYANLARMGAPVSLLDVGGGLGVDYLGSRDDDPSSMNYDLKEYARVVVQGVRDVCDRAGIEHPTLISESGRATVAHHSVLVVEVLGTASPPSVRPVAGPRPDADPALHHLWQAGDDLGPNNLLSVYHDVVASRDRCLSLFRLGHLTLEERALAGSLFDDLCRRMLEIAEAGAGAGGELPKELEGLGERLAETYLCNFSVFQSLPDAWAVGQLFPVVPLQRLDEEPTARAVLADLTCDSDGRLDRFPGREGETGVLELPPFEAPSEGGEPYHLGIFLVGAYQEILGDLHNLFGDTHITHVYLDPEGGHRLETEDGETVADVLSYVRYSPAVLTETLRRATRAAVDSGSLTARGARALLERYARDLRGYTYLEP